MKWQYSSRLLPLEPPVSNCDHYDRIHDPVVTLSVLRYESRCKVACIHSGIDPEIPYLVACAFITRGLWRANGETGGIGMVCFF
jgi:hypothetical protein